MSQDKSGAAFPAIDGWGNNVTGMTLRQYYAGQALMGLLANPHIDSEIQADEVAKGCLMLADALIKHGGEQ